MDEVKGLHHHEPLVVAPSVEASISFPLSGTVGGCAFVTLSAGKEVKVCHGEVETAVGTTEDVRVANAMLHGDGVACNDGAVVVERCPGVGIVRDGHVESVVGILMIDHYVGAHLCFCGHLGSLLCVETK